MNLLFLVLNIIKFKNNMLHKLPTINIKISTNIVYYLEKYYINSRGYLKNGYYIFNELSFGKVHLYILTNINTFYNYKRYSSTKSFNYYY
jgi:hypothetical protein